MSPIRLFGCAVVGLIVLLTAVPGTRGLEIPPEAKETVAFIYGTVGTNEVPDGTGFFVGVPDPARTKAFRPYLVTTKHVLQYPDGNWRSEIRVRLNRHDGTTAKVVCPLVENATNVYVLTNADRSVDVGVIPWNVAEGLFDFKVLGVDMFAMPGDVKALNLREGSEVFFAGMFVYHMGSKRNVPILRFGKLCLVSDEKIDFGGEARDLYLVEANCFGGNSGAPVFFLTGYENPPNVNWGAPRSLRLAGVLMGHFNDTVIVKTIPTANAEATFPSMGITAVAPAQKLYEILFSEEAKRQRGEH
jgi:hypothetical protein